MPSGPTCRCSGPPVTPCVYSTAHGRSLPGDVIVPATAVATTTGKNASSSSSRPEGTVGTSRSAPAGRKILRLRWRSRHGYGRRCMAGDEHRVLIIGGGIGGLSAAIALQREGIAVRVFERSSELHEVGAGVGLQLGAV